MTSLVDCSHEVVDGMTTYPGLPGPTITTHLSREDTAQRMAPGISFQIGRIDMVANTGTYIDSPWHFHADGADLAGLALAQIADLPAVVVHLDGHDGGIGTDAASGGRVRGSRGAVPHRMGPQLAHGSIRRVGATPHARGRRRRCSRSGSRSSASTRSTSTRSPTSRRPAHHGLLGAGVPIVEHLTHLDQLPERGARFFAVPPKVSGFGTFPVRAFAMIGT